MSYTGKNLPVSVLARLYNKAKADGRNHQDLIHYYAIERFLYRLAQSPYANDFVLKGALIFLGWGLNLPRPTRDIDLCWHVPYDVEAMSQMIRAVCNQPVVDDGMVFDANSVRGERIQERGNFQGVRLTFAGKLGQARAPIQIDIGFADVIVPGELMLQYPTFLDMPAPQLRGYPPETVVAEKFSAMVELGTINSRMKDFYDIWLMMGIFTFEGSILVQAIRATFQHNGIPIPKQAPVALTTPFAEHNDKQQQWRAFIKRNQLLAPTNFIQVIQSLRDFLLPLLTVANDPIKFEQVWRPGGPWT